MSIKKHLTIEHAIHSVMVCFAASSLGNVAAFLVDAGHPWQSAYLLSVALGVGLTALSIMLTGVDRDSDSGTFWTILSAAAALGVLSGALQSAEYAKHLSILWSLFLGFLSPLAGEVGLAWASSLYAKANKRKRFASIGADLESSVADVMTDAMQNVDRAAVQKRVDRVLNQMAALAIDSAAEKAMALYVKQPAQIAKTEPVVLVEVAPNSEIDPILTSTCDDEQADIDRMSAGKQRKIELRRISMIEILKSKTPTVAELADQLSASENTIRKDLSALQEQGFALSVNGVVKLKG